ncbi:MAG: preprotein translocase subunit SecE [Planktomarina sp.]
MARTNPIQFVNQTRAEVAKVVWPSRREVMITTGMVLVFALVCALFFTGIDFVIRSGLTATLTSFG